MAPEVTCTGCGQRRKHHAKGFCRRCYNYGPGTCKVCGEDKKVVRCSQTCARCIYHALSPEQKAARAEYHRKRWREDPEHRARAKVAYRKWSAKRQRPTKEQIFDSFLEEMRKDWNDLDSG